MFRTIPGSTIFYPSDAVSCERAVELAANKSGVCFIRTSRPNTAVIYANNHKFEIGKANVVRQSDNDKVLLIGAGITLYEALNAADQLEKAGIKVRVLDPFTIKPLDHVAVIENAKAVGGRIVVVEDHYQEGGLGEAVMHAVAEHPHIVVKHLAVDRVPRSGPPTVLIDMFGLSARHIVKAVDDVLKIQM